MKRNDDKGWLSRDRQVSKEYIIWDFPRNYDAIIPFFCRRYEDADINALQTIIDAYLPLAPYNIEDVVCGICYAFDMDADTLVSDMGISNWRRPDVCRIEDGWACSYCGKVWNNARDAKMHVRHFHSIKEPTFAPEWMKFYLAREVNPNNNWHPMNQYNYAIEIADTLDMYHNVGNDDDHEDVFMNIRQHRRLRERHKDEDVTTRYRTKAFQKRLAHLETISRQKGMSFILDDIIRENALPLIDAMILINRLRAEFLVSTDSMVMRRMEMDEDLDIMYFKAVERFMRDVGIGVTKAKEWFHGSILERSGLMYLKDGTLTVDDNLIERFSNHMENRGGESRGRSGKIYNVTWSDVPLDQVVLPEKTRTEIEMALSYWRKREKAGELWGVKATERYGNGMTILLSGEPGTGKTYTAYAIAHELGMPVFEANIENIYNLYVGETEKNIKYMFRKAEEEGALLLLDEADALLSKRTKVKRSADRHFNSDVNVLLQNMEKFNGIVVLTTNLGINLDKALERRLALKVVFNQPDGDMRRRLWKVMLPDKGVDGAVDIDKLADRYELNGGQIRNVIRGAMRRAVYRAEMNKADIEDITPEDLRSAVEAEITGGEAMVTDLEGQKKSGEPNRARKRDHSEGYIA